MRRRGSGGKSKLSRAGKREPTGRICSRPATVLPP
ncbi:hypothetical protein Tco_0579777, partial [Tanacetum coccineum]